MVINIAQHDRMQLVRSFVEQQQQVTIEELALQFEISPATVRRTLTTLAERGEIRRVRGGAQAVRTAPPELPVLQRAERQRAAKARIGQTAAAMVADGETVFLGSGTTVLEVARHLIGREDLTVLTNSLLVINTLVDVSDIEVVALGGVLRRSELSLIGHVAEQTLREVRATKVFMGIRAVHPEHGLTNDYLPETMTDRAVLRLGGDVVLVADHTKFGSVSTAFLAPVTAVDVIVTDNETPDASLAALTSQGVKVIRA